MRLKLTPPKRNGKKFAKKIFAQLNARQQRVGGTPARKFVRLLFDKVSNKVTPAIKAPGSKRVLMYSERTLLEAVLCYDCHYEFPIDMPLHQRERHAYLLCAKISHAKRRSFFMRQFVKSQCAYCGAGPFASASSLYRHLSKCDAKPSIKCKCCVDEEDGKCYVIGFEDAKAVLTKNASKPLSTLMCCATGSLGGGESVAVGRTANN